MKAFRICESEGNRTKKKKPRKWRAEDEHFSLQIIILCLNAFPDTRAYRKEIENVQKLLQRQIWYKQSFFVFCFCRMNDRQTVNGLLFFTISGVREKEAENTKRNTGDEVMRKQISFRGNESTRFRSKMDFFECFRLSPFIFLWKNFYSRIKSSENKFVDFFSLWAATRKKSIKIDQHSRNCQRFDWNWKV